MGITNSIVSKRGATICKETDKVNLEIVQSILGVTRGQVSRWKAQKGPVKGKSEPVNKAHSLGDTKSLVD